jgi:hypothetical protein
MACRLTLKDRSSFYARQQARLAERAGQKIILQRQLSDLGMQRLHVDHRHQFSLRSIAEYPGRAFQQLVTPLLDLIRMDVKVLRQLDQSSFTLDSGYSYFRLEGRAVLPRAVVLSW